MDLVRVCYAAIRESKTCSGSFGRRTETLSVYVILNCWSTLLQKSNCVNKMFREHAAFGSSQEKVTKILAKRERTGQCQPSLNTHAIFSKKNRITAERPSYGSKRLLYFLILIFCLMLFGFIAASLLIVVLLISAMLFEIVQDTAVSEFASEQLSQPVHPYQTYQDSQHSVAVQ